MFYHTSVRSVLVSRFIQMRSSRTTGAIEVSETGITGGITFVLNVAPSEYTDYVSSGGYGFYVYIYDTQQTVSDENDPIAVSVGTHTLVGIEKHKRTVLPKPYAPENCVNTEETKHQHYTRDACINKCKGKRVYNSFPNCTCDVEATDGDNQCTLHDLYYCAYTHSLTEGSNSTECHCRHPCTQTYYDKAISSVIFPNENYINRAQLENWQFKNKSDIHDNYASVHIYFRSLAETSTIENTKNESC